MTRGTLALVSRRQFLHTIGSTALAASVGAKIIVPGRASAQPKTLRILQWKHFVPGYDIWFNDTYTKEWGEKNHTTVIVENVGLGDIPNRAAEESKAQHGHDLFAHVYPLPAYEDEVIDHHDLYEECERKYGKAHDLALKTTYNPKTQKFWGFADYYYVLPTNYRKDLWEAVGTVPDTWEHVRQGGRKIKLMHDKPVGIGLGGDGDGEAAVRAMLYSFGASEQDADNRPALKSPAALEVFKFVKALYEETMTAEVLTWDAASNNRLMLEGAGSLVLNAISIPRTAENTKNPVGEQIWLAPGPQGPVRRLTPVNGIQSYLIWKFAKNIDGAKQFLVDYMGQFRHGFLVSGFYNMPCFPHTVPDMQALLSHNAKATPPDKYKVLSDAGDWTTNVGYPGYTNAAIAEVFNSGLIGKLMGQAATGKLTPEEALNQADAQVQRIFQTWRERGKI
jgi:multiple sugar transport system substrate-binding protein